MSDHRRFRSLPGGLSIAPPRDGAAPGDGSGFFAPRPDGYLWETVVVAAARAAGVRVIDRGRPVALELDFRLPRPSVHRRTDGTLRVGYLFVATSGLADDMSRQVLVGLTGTAWVDAMQVADLRVRKIYASSAAEVGVHVRIREVDCG